MKIYFVIIVVIGWNNLWIFLNKSLFRGILSGVFLDCFVVIIKIKGVDLGFDLNRNVF